jgi:hypothetical protein
VVPAFSDPPWAEDPVLDVWAKATVPTRAAANPMAKALMSVLLTFV